VRRHVIGWCALWFAFFWLWMLLVGEWNHYEWIAASVTSAVAATIGEIARARADVRARVPLRVVAGSWSVIHQIFVDFAIITWALVVSGVRREVVRGSFRAHPFEAGDDDQPSTGMRAWVQWAASFSPNAIAIDIDKERNLSLVHDLIRNRASEKPA